MKIAYLECATGISGDMTLAALVDAGVDFAGIRSAIDSLGLPGVTLELDEVMKGGFRAKSFRVNHPEQHAHRHYSDIVKIVEGASDLTAPQRSRALELFRAIGEAEAQVHGSTLERIHFHEVGAIDSIVDIVGAAVGFDLLAPDLVVSGSIPTGRGQVRIDHGICPVPTPGTAELLKGIPLRDIPVEAELTTPTGAAIVKTFVDRFGPLPEMTVSEVGYGAGSRDFPHRANLLRIFVGQHEVAPGREPIFLLETQVDDVAGEVVGYTREQLMNAGALDVFTTAVQMKKDRPGTQLSVLCRPAVVERMEQILFNETGTLGVRRQLIERAVLNRQPYTVSTPWGTVLGKLAWLPDGQPAFSPEFEACAVIARETGRPLREVYRAAVAAFDVNAVVPQSTAPTVNHEHTHDHEHHHEHDHDHDHDGHHPHDHDHDHDR